MLSLLCHPDHPAKDINIMQASAVLDAAGHLALTYLVSCPADIIEAGYPKNSVRTDGLWQTTCFEIFVKIEGETSYLEYNLAPSGDWAVYAFAGRRDGMTLPEVEGPQIKITASDELYTVGARVALPARYQGHTLQVGLSAVVEEKHGTKSYWALAHGNGPADFHDPACFIHQVTAAGGHEKRN